MIQEIMRDAAFLAQKAELAVPADLQVGSDLLETLSAHKDSCVGMAADMIGVNKRIISFDNEGSYIYAYRHYGACACFHRGGGNGQPSSAQIRPLR